MDSPDENSIDDFALEMLRRAKERKQVISCKLKQQPESVDQDQSIEKIMEKLEKKSSVSSIASPTKAKSESPMKYGGTRPILKQISTNDNRADEGTENTPRKVSLKKSVTTCDAMTGDTIVEAKTFISEGEEDDEDDDEDVEMEEVEQNEASKAIVNEDLDDNIDELPKDEDLDNEEDEDAVKSILTTPLVSKTLSKLSEFHSNKEVNSPVHPHTCLETFNEGNPDDAAAEVIHVSASRKARTSRLSALARTINEWEDDTSHLSIPGSRFHETPPASNNRASLAGKSKYSSASSPSASSPLSLGSGRQGQITGVRLFHNKTNSNLGNNKKSSNRNSGVGQGQYVSYGEGEGVNSNSNSENKRLGFEHTVLTKLQSKLSQKVQNQANDDSIVQKSNDDWDEALMKSLELQGFSRRQGSPLKQIREQTPDPLKGEDEKSQKEASPKKTYFGGSPSRGSPFKATPPASQAQVNSPSSRSSPAKPVRVSSPLKSTSPAPASSPMHSVVASNSNLRSRRSPSPMKSTGYGGSPLRGGKSSANEPAAKPVSAIRMRFEGGGGVGGAPLSKPGPAKPDRTRFKPYTHTPTNSGGNSYKSSYASSSSSSSPVKKYNFGESEKDPSLLSVAERAKLFERSKFAVAAPKKPVITEAQQQKTPNIFTSSPCTENFRPQEIDVSSVVPPPAEQEFMSPTKKRLAPLPPAVSQVTASPNRKGPAPPPPPPMPTTSTPTNAHSKRRSTSPARSFPKEQHSVKRIKVNAPKPGNVYPSLTDIETETETDVEGHCTEGDSMDDSIGSEQSLGAEIETIAKACSPIRPAAGGRMPSRYRPSEDFSATFACAAVDAFIDEALEGQDMTGTTMNFSTTMCESEKFARGLERVSESDSASLERTVVSVDKSVDMLCTSAQSDSLDETPSEPDVLEDAQEVSCSEADTTASSSFTTSPASLSKLNTNSADAVAVNNVKHVESEMPPAAAAQSRFVVKKVEPQPTEEDFVPRTLTHTVSFYRKTQQQQKKNEASAGLNDISEQAEGSECSDEDVPVHKPNIGQLIRKLESEVEGRNLSIAQASKALNWCKALVGFSDSTEYIECERILLIETQRRLALLNSIHRLKTEGAIGREMPAVFSPSKQDVTPSCKGNMNISNIAVTLRREFFTAHRVENQYHFIGLVKNKHHIEHTTLLTYDSQKQGSTLRFPNDFVLEGLDPDFQINLEIYYLESAKEFLPHEAKYRINAKKDSKQATMMLSPLLTPSKKGGKNDHHHKSHQIQSPAGPDTVKSSSFKFCGGLYIDISSLQRTYWELDKAAGPLSGGISIKVQCSAMGGVEHKGFLTLFEDVSGYGAWVRRWCRLGPAVLEFWKYPEDETEGRKPPLGTLNLHECVTSRVRPAPRDVCARANTLLLVTTRAPHPNDKDTLVTSCHKGYTAVRHLISADTREERDAWCQQLNKALANLRAWDPVAKQSVDDNLF